MTIGSTFSFNWTMQNEPVRYLAGRGFLSFFAQRASCWL